MSLEIPTDPVVLASPLAELRFTDTSFEGSPDDIRDLIELDRMADDSGLLGAWTVEAFRGFVTPASFDADLPVTRWVLDSLFFEGDFACYSRLSIGRFMGQGAVRALCLTFGKGTLVSPVFVPLDDVDLLHIPVLSVKSIARQN